MSMYEAKVKGDFEIFEKYFISSIDKELSTANVAGQTALERDGLKIHIHVLEKYFWRNNSYSSLTVVLEKDEDEIGITAICAGAGVGFLGYDWGADERWMRAVRQAIKQWNDKLANIPAKR